MAPGCGAGSPAVGGASDVSASIQRRISGRWGGRNSRLDEMQAAVLSAKLGHLEKWNERRRGIVKLYCELLRDAAVETPGAPDESDAAHLYVIRTARPDELRAALAEQGIAADVHYPIPDHRQSAYAGASWTDCELPVTEECCGTILSLPCFPEMRDEEVAWIAAVVGEAG